MNEKRIMKILYFLKNNNIEATVQDMQIGCHISQPELSIGCTELLKRKWIAVRMKSRMSGKGRPTNMYRLNINIEEIIKYYKLKYSEEYNIKIKELNNEIKI